MAKISDKVCLVPIHGAIGMKLGLKNPVATNRFLARRQRDQVPGSVSL